LLEFNERSFLHRDLVLFVLLQYVLDLSDFDLSGSSFWSASHFCLLLHWPALCLALDSFCRGCFFFLLLNLPRSAAWSGVRFCCFCFPSPCKFQSCPAALSFSWICLSVNLPVYPASQGDGGPAVHESFNSAAWCLLKCDFFYKFLVCESLQEDPGIALELPDQKTQEFVIQIALPR
jgi:hypothetical protein